MPTELKIYMKEADIQFLAERKAEEISTDLIRNMGKFSDKDKGEIATALVAFNRLVGKLNGTMDSKNLLFGLRGSLYIYEKTLEEVGRLNG